MVHGADQVVETGASPVFSGLTTSPGFKRLFMPLSTGEMHWQNAWDLLGWKECDATVETQGFAADGTVVLRVRKSVMAQPRRANCVEETGLYAVDLTNQSQSPSEFDE